MIIIDVVDDGDMNMMMMTKIRMIWIQVVCRRNHLVFLG